MIDYKYINKVIVRNLSESSDKHDLIKTQLYRILRRKYPNCPCYTEYPLGKEIPDIYYEIKGKIFVVEIQKEVSPSWIKNILERYKDVNLIIIETKKISNDILEMKKQLEEFV